MARKKKNNNLVIISIFLVLSIIVIIIGGGLFSLFDTQQIRFYQYNGVIREDWGSRVVKSDTFSILDNLNPDVTNVFQIKQYKEYYNRPQSDYYCSENTCNGESIGFDEYGCESWVNDSFFYGYTQSTGDWTRIKTYAQVEDNIKCYAGRPDSTRIYVCSNGYQEFAGWYDKLAIYGKKTCGGLTRDYTSDSNIRSCWHKFDVFIGDRLFYSEEDFSNKRETVYIYMGSKDPMVGLRDDFVRKTLNRYSDIDGYVDCPYYKDETIQSCSVLYGSHINSRDFLVDSYQLIDVVNNKPIPYLVGMWAENENKRRITSDYEWLTAEFKQRSESYYDNCQLIENAYLFTYPESAFDINISSPKDYYFKGENASVEVKITNNLMPNVKLGVDITFGIPTAFGDKERKNNSLINLDFGENVFVYDIPTEDVVDLVKIKLSGTFLMDGSLIQGVNDGCYDIETGIIGNTLYPASSCDYISVGRLNDIYYNVSIKEVEIVPDFCLERGYDTIVTCNNYVENYINILDMDIDEKIALIEELEISRQEKIELILQLEANIEEQQLIIGQFEMTIDEQRGYIQALGLTIDEQETLINSLELTVTEKQQLIESLETELDNMARDIIALELTTQQQADYIQNLSLNIEEQTSLINKLTSNLEIKAELVSQLTAENEIQAELIAEMEASFSRQGEIISNLNNTIQDDAIIIQELTQKSEEQGMIIEGMKLTINEQRDLILSLTESNEEMGRIISQLKLKNDEQKELIIKLTKSLDEQVLIVSQMKLTLEEQRDLVEELTNKISEQEEIIENLKIKLEEEKSRIGSNDTPLYVGIGIFVSIFLVIIYLRFFNK